MPLDLARIEAVCFDVDGTLADTDDHLVQQLAGFLARLPFLSGREGARMARRIVMDAETPVNAAYGLADRLGIDDELAQARSYLNRLQGEGRNAEAADRVPHTMIAGVEEAVEKLAARFPMSTISTGGAERVEAFLEHYGVRRHFAAVVTAQTTDRMKPFPDPLLHAAEAMGVAPEACVMIGDTTVDVRTAVAAGAQSIGVLCGFGTEDELRRAGADRVLATTSDVLPVLLPESTQMEGSADPEASVKPPTGG